MTETSTAPAVDLTSTPRTDAQLAVHEAPRPDSGDDARAAATRDIVDTLTSLRQASASLVEVVAAVSREYAQHVATADPADLVEHTNPVTGERYIELVSERGRLLQRRMTALAEMSYDPRAAVHAVTRATHDLRLLADQSTEIGGVTVSFDPALRGPGPDRLAEIEAQTLVVEAEEVD